MVNYCCAFNCSSTSDVNKELQFHKFPLNDKERLQKWVHAVRRKDFKPSNSSFLCSLHFGETDYTPAIVSGKPMLKKTSIPSVFKFPEHLMPKCKERRILHRVVETEDIPPSQNIEDTHMETNKFIDVGVQTKLSGEDLDRTLNDLRRDKRILQQKLLRRDKREKCPFKTKSLIHSDNLIGKSRKKGVTCLGTVKNLPEN